MDKRQILGLGTFLAGSYTTFHGHRLHKDCWLCNYRGWGWIIAFGAIVYNDYLEKHKKNSTPYQYSHRDTYWENDSNSSSDDSNETIKGTN